MFDILFGVEVPIGLKILLGFFVVFGLIGLIAWGLRRYAGERFGGSAARGRQPRLAVVDAAPLNDGRRKLVIIRRDNVEHLLMIGGPTDVVVEQNIVRAMGAPRDKVEPTIGRGLSVSETLTRPVPLGEGNLWPLQPQPETNGRAPRAVPEEPMQWTWPAHPEPQRVSRPEPRPEKPDTLTNLSDELSARTVPAREPAATRPVTPPPVSRPTPPAPAPVAAEKVEKIEKITAIPEPDQDLADLANRLEPSLRRPSEPRAAAEPPMYGKPEPMVPPAPRAAPEPRIAPPEPRVTPLEPRITAPEPRITPPEPRVAPPEQKPARAEAKPKAVFDSLEEEMASLLGRPPGKT